ncbi:bifunctional alpha,alpha-trehalose-phosphate synthase (UDP-forming)/trehalose-phosphatase [Mucilaginibacter sp. KACC 22773]|uniref:bifunctional alpha,alpha-trehalose-phosphate synthase (UDP-forming)/trehalose-phosphatase n=1 Tax=Mucilaginibacter sp. KACC 22773 TaxID=3025671 RepID=UPI0023655127|nr:bifunctional alpha,alpha-trehalose-phosphate synthase (UDP-forming)/trehalose-phosphatase [Mucilaginibacter sp. KACC 22773]WDF80995.1 bifunctional alpha,alpha-trehalose-phosphate synthase (UDP-forming)/trehalose-phosphatase [Mucilaginibacter sp. KACC 22773]
MPKTIIVSNRLPVKISKTDSDYNLSSSEGGLATGLGSIYKQGDNVWIGWPGVEITEQEDKDTVTQQLKELSLVPVFLDQEEINQYYEGFSNEVLWPVFHYYASTYATYKQSNWDYYQAVNKKFRDVILTIAEPGDVIWIHDYQLLLLPALVRQEIPDVSIGFFLHIPFPSHEMFRLIPWRSELLEGMLGADLIGLHTFDDVRHFLGATTRILPVTSSANIIATGERSIVVESFPMGIDEQKYASLPLQDDVKHQVELIKNNFKDGKLILSVDRLDYSKGILQRLAAFELLLQLCPECIENIALYMIVVPSRDTVPQYAHLRDEIDKKVGNINSIYRTMDWSPIHYYYRSFPLETLAALYATADVCLVTPMRDGMNLVSKEYVASRVNNDGVLIMSEMAGASKELIDAIIVNPNNTGEVCRAILQAINMPLDEQKKRMIPMRQLVAKFNIRHWVKIFMDRLKEVKLMQRSLQTRHVSNTTEQSIINRYSKTKKRIIFLDYDGTLVGFRSDIEQASPDKELYHIIQKLTEDPANQVVLISGRKHENLDEWFQHTDMYLIAEHGSWFKQPGTTWHKIAGLSDQWKHDIYPLLETYVDRTPGSFIEEKTYSLVWHYRKAQAGLGELRAGELMNNLKYLASDKGLQLLAGDKVLEVKNMDINKGKAALTLTEGKDYDFVIAFGDDYTDEDIFKALPESAITIKVGSNLSAAKFYLRNPQEVRKLLTSFTKQYVGQNSGILQD